MENKDRFIEVPVVRVKLYEDFKIKVSSKKAYGIEEAGKIFYELIGSSTIEKSALLCLDNDYNILNASIVNIGTIDNVEISISEIFRIALLSNAKRIILAHNHPSNNMQPSNYDIKITKNIGNLSRLFKMELIDSVIVGNELNKIYSIRNNLENLKES